MQGIVFPPYRAENKCPHYHVIQYDGFYRSRKGEMLCCVESNNTSNHWRRSKRHLWFSQQTQIPNKSAKKTKNIWILCPGSCPTRRSVQHHFELHSMCELRVHCVESAPQTVSLRLRSLRSSSLHQDNELSWPDKEAAEKNGGRWWWVSADLRDPDQAGTEAAELDTTVVTLR